jgi:hypothetical protein
MWKSIPFTNYTNWFTFHNKHYARKSARCSSGKLLQNKKQKSFTAFFKVQSMFPICKLFVHNQIQSHYRHIVFNVRKKNSKWTKITQSWGRKYIPYVSKLQAPNNLSCLQWNYNLQDNLIIGVVPTIERKITIVVLESMMNVKQQQRNKK